MEYKDYYKVLGVDRKASAEEIKMAYRHLARKYHPDISKEKGAEAKFKEIGEANDVLGDGEKRMAYDELGPGFEQGQQFRPPPGWNENHQFRQRTDKTHANASSGAAEFSDFFEEMFGGRQGGFSDTRRASQGSPMRMRGEDSHARVTIALRDTFVGVSRQLSLRMPVMDAAGNVVLRDKTLSVKIPKGLIAGQVIRLKGQGGAGIGGESNGDLYLEVEFAPDKLYKVEGKDLFMQLPVAPWEAALGAAVQVPTPSGDVMVKVPPNSVQGRELRLKGKGIPAAEPGDLHVMLTIVLPKADTEKSRKLYYTMARELAFDPRAGLDR
jgi:curved DNA-binding protein